MSLLDDQPQRMAREKRQLEALARGTVTLAVAPRSATSRTPLTRCTARSMAC